MGITVEQAQKGIVAGLAKAAAINSPSSISILDDGRNLVAFARMDGALLASIEISKAKAYTARSLNMKTGKLNNEKPMSNMVRSRIFPTSRPTKKVVTNAAAPRGLIVKPLCNAGYPINVCKNRGNSAVVP